MGVSGYQQAASERFINALSAELTGSVEAMANAVEYGLLYGNSVDAYQFDGIDTFVSTDATAKQSIDNGGSIADFNAALTLSDLDDMLDHAENFRGLQSDNKVFIATPQMISRISALQTKMSRESQDVEFEGGFRMRTYRGVPLYPSGFLKPASTTTSPAVTATKAAGGSLADDEWFYAISSVTQFGEQLVGTVDSDTTETTNNTVNLTWTADSNAMLYKVWRGTSAGTLQLLTTIKAKTYDSSGAVTGSVESFSDTGALTPNSAILPLSTGHETLMLVNLSEERGINMLGMMNPLGDTTPNWLTYVPLSIRKSAFEYMIEAFIAAKCPYPRLHVIGRRAKLA